MYSTVKEIHVAIMSRLQQVNSNRKRVFRPEELDEAFNSTMLKFIEERSIIADTDDGLLENVKRYDELQELNIINKEVSMFIKKGSSNLTSKSFCILPVDYYKFESLKVSQNYECERTFKDLVLTVKPFIYNHTLFPTPSAASDYTTVTLSDSSGTIYYNAATRGINLYNIESKFIIINDILTHINSTTTTDIYWETYGDIYVPNSFITTNGEALTLIIGSITRTPITITTSYEEMGSSNMDVSTELIASKELNNAKDNYYMYKNRYKKPFVCITQNSINIDFNSEYISTVGYLTYIKRPILINSKYNTMTDFKSRIEQIVDLTVSILALTLGGSGQELVAVSTKNT